MQPMPRAVIAGMVLLCVLLFLGVRPRAPARHATPAWLVPPPPRTPAAVALREAWRYQGRAQMAANQQRGVLEGWDPGLGSRPDPEVWRLQTMASDPTGDLRLARTWARRAAALARTPDELFQATALEVMLDHEAGDHRAELRQARQLLALAPGSAPARMLLQRAEQRCELRRPPQRQGR